MRIGSVKTTLSGLYERKFLIETFICAHNNTFSGGPSESTLNERYL